MKKINFIKTLATNTRMSVFERIGLVHKQFKYETPPYLMETSLPCYDEYHALSPKSWRGLNKRAVILTILSLYELFDVVYLLFLIRQKMREWFSGKDKKRELLEIEKAKLVSVIQTMIANGSYRLIPGVLNTRNSHILRNQEVDLTDQDSDQLHKPARITLHD